MSYCKPISRILTVFGVLLGGAVCQADVFPYQQGFETDTSGWTTYSDGSAPNPVSTITRVASGTNGINAADGNWYAQVTNADNSYTNEGGSGCCIGQSGYSVFGGNGTYPGGAFYQSIDVYIDTSLTQPVGYDDAYWIDMSPSSSSPYDVANNYGTGYGDEQNFRLDYSTAAAGTVSVTVGSGDPTPETFDITQTGWYQFTTTYDPSGAPTALVNTTMSITDLSNNSLVGSDNVLADQNGETLQNQYLDGPGYVWLTVWQNGFSNDLLNIDDIQTGPSAVPEPTSILLLATVAALFAWGMRRKQART